MFKIKTMKKSLTLFVIFALSTGISFASFQVKKQQKNVNPNSVTVEKAQVETSTPHINEVSEIPVIKTDDALVNSEGETNSSDDSKDKTVAIILAFVSVLILPLGLHNWYLGKTKRALWQTLMVIPGAILILPAVASWIWQFIDLIVLLAKGL